MRGDRWRCAPTPRAGRRRTGCMPCCCGGYIIPICCAPPETQSRGSQGSETLRLTQATRTRRAAKGLRTWAHRSPRRDRRATTCERNGRGVKVASVSTRGDGQGLVRSGAKRLTHSHPRCCCSRRLLAATPWCTASTALAAAALRPRWRRSLSGRLLLHTIGARLAPTYSASPPSVLPYIYECSAVTKGRRVREGGEEGRGVGSRRGEWPHTESRRPQPPTSS